MQEYIEFFKAHPMLSLAWVGLFIAVIVMTVKSSLSKVSNVDNQQATLLINKQDAKVIDVRSTDEYRKGHIVNAMHIPLADIKNNQIPSLEKYRTSPIIVVCNTGMTSAQAAQMLSKLGYEQVSNLKGGMGEWQAANMPVVKGKK